MRLNRGVSEGLKRRARAGSRALWSVGACCLLVAGACATQPKSAPQPQPGKVVDLNGDSQQEAGPASVQVENQNLADMTIFLYVGGLRTRLGRASSNTTTKLLIPKSLINGVTQVRFQAQPLGNRRGYTSELVPVSPGDLVDFYVPAY
ncbi:MAG: hypothetical protein ABIP93_00425 [Gemmatimonadaceae bacterium]